MAPGLGLADAIGPEARALYRRALVINGNMVSPIDTDGHITPKSTAAVRSSGITAFKMTLGGTGNETAKEVTGECADLDKAIARSPDVYMKIGSAADFAEAKRTGRIGIVYSFEAGEMLEGKVENVDHFRRLGVLVMGLSYNKPTPFASGVMSKTSTGLTELGRQAVARMNQQGVTVDVSHSDEASSLGAIEASGKPVLITHAGAAAIRPHPRNKSDRLMRALAERGGVMGIYELSYLSVTPEAPGLNAYLAHLEHALDVCGEDHVGIGSDASLTPFDTSPKVMAAWNKEIERRKATGVAAPGEGPPPFVVGLNRPDRMLVIADALLKRGHPSRVVEKVLGSNFQRVFAETWTG
jgi:membrane dipeptidase